MRRGAHAVAGALAAAFGIAFAPRASAESVASCPLRPEDRGCVSLSTTFSASPSGGEVSTLHFAPQLAASVRFARRFAVTADVTAASTSYRVYGEEGRRTVRMGNPILGVHYAPWESARGFFRVGLVLGPPLVTVPGTISTNVAAEYGDRVSAAARGFSGYWLWARNQVPIAAAVRAEASFPAGVVLGAGLEPAVLVSVNSLPSRVALAADASVAYRLGPVTPGVRVQAFVSSMRLAEADFAQVALAPFVRLDLGRGFWRGEVDIDLDGPSGLAGARNATVWGVTLGGGARF